MNRQISIFENSQDIFNFRFSNTDITLQVPQTIFSHFNRTTEHLTVYFYFGATYPFVMVHSTSLLWCVLPLRCGAFWPCVGSFYPAAALGLFVEILEKIDENK